MLRPLLVVAVFAIAAAPVSRLTHGEWSAEKSATALEYQVCGQAKKPDGGRLTLEHPCIPCSPPKGQPPNGPYCEREWKRLNELP